MQVQKGSARHLRCAVPLHSQLSYTALFADHPAIADVPSSCVDHLTDPPTTDYQIERDKAAARIEDARR